MKIENNLLREADFYHTNKQGGVISPKVIVLHYTAGVSYEGDFNVLFKKRNNVSCHLLIGRKGQIGQGVPFNKKAWHAGPSKYKNFIGLNDHSIGIELENPGYIKESKSNKGLFYNWNEKISYKYSDIERNGWELHPEKHPRLGSFIAQWIKYPEAQLNVLEEIVSELLATYPTIQHIVSHEEIDKRGWKTDPGPAFPMQRYIHMLSRKENNFEDDSIQYYEVAVDRLNVRDGPSLTYQQIDRIFKGDMVQYVERSGEWIRYIYHNNINATISEGWSHGAYLTALS